MGQLARRIPNRFPSTLPTRMVAAGLGASALILLAACGSGSSYSAPAYTGPAGNTAAPSAGATAAPAPGTPVATNTVATNTVATNTVAIQNFAFAPATVTVKVGTTITWTNQDQDPHTVTAMGSGTFKSPTLNKGQSFHYRFTTPGQFTYLCTIHPFMTATVVVTP